MTTPAESPQAAPPAPYPERLSAWYEELAHLRPQRYRLELATLALLGHAYVVGVAVAMVFLGLMLMVLGPQGVALLIGASIVAGRLLWTFWVKRAEPVGVTLNDDMAHDLLNLVDRARARLRCGAPRRIVVSLDCNAAVDASAWRGNVRTLLIGFPLLVALSPRELEALVAHELGHVSRAHGRFGAWIHYVRATWANLAQVASWGPVAWLLNTFAKWYWPRLDACSLVQARTFELQADQDAIALTGPDAFVHGLARSVLTAARLDEVFWPRVWMGAAEEPEPPTDLCDRLVAELRTPDPDQDRRLERARAFRTMYWDTHPSLAKRAAACGQSLDALPAPEASAAEALLGARLPDLVRSLDASWREMALPAWTERHRSLTEGRARMAELDAARSGSLQSVEADWERAAWTEELSGAEAALPLYRALLDRAPGHHAAELALGRLLLQRQDPSGVALLQQSMSDPWLVLAATELLYDHFASQGRHDEADHYHRLAAAHGQTMEKATLERSTFTATDRPEPHDLTPEALDRLRKLIDRPQVSEAYLVRKPVRLFPEKPCLVLGVKRRMRWYQMSTPQAGLALITELAQTVDFDVPLLFIDLDQDRSSSRRIERVPGSRILPA